MTEELKFKPPEFNVIELLTWARNFSRNAPLISPRDSLMLGLMAGQLHAFHESTEQLGAMLEQLTVIVKGEPEPGCVWGFEDLPELVGQLVAQARGEVH